MMRKFADPYFSVSTGNFVHCFLCEETFRDLGLTDNHLYDIHHIEISTDALDKGYYYAVKQRVVR